MIRSHGKSRPHKLNVTIYLDFLVVDAVNLNILQLNEWQKVS